MVPFKLNNINIIVIHEFILKGHTIKLGLINVNAKK